MYPGRNSKHNVEAYNLTTALKGDSQQRGAWGEAQLERTLQMSGLREGDHYDVQESFRDPKGTLKRTDYVVKLPDGKHLIIDSKVNLPDYDSAITAQTEGKHHPPNNEKPFTAKPSARPLPATRPL